MNSPSSPTGVPPDWYEDPLGRHQFRYWDGESWTEQVADDGQQSVDPIGIPGSEPEAASFTPAAEEAAAAAAPTVPPTPRPKRHIARVLVPALLALLALVFAVTPALERGAYGTPIILAAFVIPVGVAALMWRTSGKAGITLGIVTAALVVGAVVTWGWAQYSASAAFDSAEEAFAEKNWYHAVREFETVQTRYPLSGRTDEAAKRADDARIEWARSLSAEDIAQIRRLLRVVLDGATPEQEAAVAGVYTQVGDRFAKSGDLAEAAEVYREARAIAGDRAPKKLKDKLANVLAMQAKSEMAAGDPVGASDLLTEAAFLTSDRASAKDMRARAFRYSQLEPPSVMVQNLRDEISLSGKAKICTQVLTYFPKSPDATTAVKAMRGAILADIESLESDADYYRKKVNQVGRSGSARYQYRFATDASAYRAAGKVLSGQPRTKGFGAALVHMAKATGYGKDSVARYIDVAGSIATLRRCDSELAEARADLK